MAITANTYFSGAGLFDVGLIKSGINIGQSFEIDHDAVKTYRANIGDHVKHCDLTTELVLDQQACDLMVFSYPCNKYSAIADIHGTRTGDELFLHALRHIVLQDVEAFVIENVPGMRAYPVVMEAMTALPGYYITTFCPIQAQNWLPQRRDRLIIIATKRPFRVSAPDKGKQIPLSAILEKDPRVTRPKAIQARMNGEYRDLPIISDPDKGDIAPTVVAHYSKDKSTRLVKDARFPLGVRPYSVREFARLQGLDDDFLFPVSDTSAYRQIGNGVPIPFGEWVGYEMVKYFNLRRAARTSSDPLTLNCQTSFL